MKLMDILRLSIRTITHAPARAIVLLVAVAIGVAAVVVLTSLGEAARRYVRAEFASLGTNLVIVIPGRTETTGLAPTLLAGATPRDLTLDDAEALYRSAAVDKVAPVVLGAAGVQWSGRVREVPIFGSTAEMIEVRRWSMAMGRFLPPGDLDRRAGVVVIGRKLRDELFGTERAIGRWLRIGDRRFRVIGILASEGHTMGIDSQDIAIIPVASAQALFNSPSLFRIIVSARSREDMEKARADIRRIITRRHQGEEDVTVTTQDAVLATFDRIFGTLTMTLAGIAAVSLVVAGILIMNVMLVSVSQRSAEIGLLNALGAPPRRIMAMFMAEALLLSSLGAVAGLILGQMGSWLIGRIYPALSMGAPLWALLAATVTALASGLIFGVLPAKRASALDPVTALARK